MSPNNQGSARLAIFTVSSWIALMHLKSCALLREFLRSTRRNVHPDRNLSYTITYNYLSRPNHLMWSVVILQFWLTKTVFCLLFDTSSICLRKFWLGKIKSLLVKIGFARSGFISCQRLAFSSIRLNWVPITCYKSNKWLKIYLLIGIILTEICPVFKLINKPPNTGKTFLLS